MLFIHDISWDFFLMFSTTLTRDLSILVILKNHCLDLFISERVFYFNSLCFGFNFLCSPLPYFLFGFILPDLFLLSFWDRCLVHWFIYFYCLMVISVFVILVYTFIFLSFSVMFVQFKWQPLPKYIAINNLYYRSTFHASKRSCQKYLPVS